MQSTVANTIKLIKSNSELAKNFPKEVIPYLLKAADNSTPQVRNDIENQIVKIGESAVSILVEALITATGSTKALAAMALIRIGTPSINPLKQACKNNSELQWTVDYIVNEIKGTGLSLNSLTSMISVG